MHQYFFFFPPPPDGVDFFGGGVVDANADIEMSNLVVIQNIFSFVSLNYIMAKRHSFA